MKIAILSRYQNTVNRGAEVFVKELSDRLVKNHEIDVLSGKDSDSIDAFIKRKYDIVFSINGRMQSLKASLGRLTKKYKLVISGQSGIGRDDIWNIAVARPDVYVALTDYEACWAKKWAWGVRVAKIPNGVDLEKFTPTGEKITLDLERPIILSVGALVWYKHHERVIEAVSRLDKGSLVVVGKGENEGKLGRLGEEKLGKRFKILSLGFDEMPKIYRSVDLFTLPSWDRESFGIAYLEAMASGLPVVAPDDEPRREIVGDAGLYVDVTDPLKYAKAVEKALRINWAGRPRKQAEKFSWDIIASKYDALFKEIVTR